MNIYYLKYHFNILLQRKIYEELKEVKDKTDGKALKENDLSHLPYFNAVIKGACFSKDEWIIITEDNEARLILSDFCKSLRM